VEGRANLFPFSTNWFNWKHMNNAPSVNIIWWASLLLCSRQINYLNSIPSQVFSISQKGYFRPRKWGSTPYRDRRFFASSQCPYRLWRPPILLPSGYWGLFPGEQSGRGVKPTTHLHLGLRNCTLTHPYIVVFNFLSIGETLFSIILNLTFLSVMIHKPHGLHVIFCFIL
jgi:hypothetical protein